MNWPVPSEPVIAVVVIDNPDAAVPVAQALYAGGVTAVEITLRTPAALDAIEAIATAVPDVLVGAGTVLSEEECTAVHERGAAFAVAPGINPAVVRRAFALGLPFAPGVATPSEIETACALGCTVLKFFPAGALGGPEYLSSVVSPYRRLGLRMIPTGGVSTTTIGDWLAVPEVVAVGGTWITGGTAIPDGNWAEITSRASAAVQAARSAGSEDHR